jgi:hypothetical protein
VTTRHHLETNDTEAFQKPCFRARRVSLFSRGWWDVSGCRALWDGTACRLDVVWLVLITVLSS